MPKFYCEYCGIYLTHSSPAGRKQHSMGRKHINAKVEYYQKLVRERFFQPPTMINHPLGGSRGLPVMGPPGYLPSHPPMASIPMVPGQMDRRYPHASIPPVPPPPQRVPEAPRGAAQGLDSAFGRGSRGFS